MKATFFVLMTASLSAFGASPLPLKTPSGTLVGDYADAAALVQVYKGIPYALPPTGNRRWGPAEAALPWKEPRLAHQFGPDCMQASTMGEVQRPEEDFFYHPPSLVSEDCLYLNVWTPVHAAKLPVMVWIHGGGEVQGSGSWPLYDGTELARKGVVLVTLNYRLGIFGRFALPELTQESPDHASGSYDLSDLLQALRWIQANIGAFGGDASKVTLMGQSSGATYIALLMSSPAASGLFHRAAAESGAAFYGPMTSLSEAEKKGAEFAKSINLPSLQQMRELSADVLLEASRQKLPYIDPIIDGHLLPASPCNVFKAGGQIKVPTLLGFNADELYELKAQMPQVTTEEQYKASVQRLFDQIGYNNEAMTAGFISMLPRDRTSLLAADPLLRYGVTGWQMESWADAMQRNSMPAYLYYFRHVARGGKSSYHTAEISFVFNHPGPAARYSDNMPASSPSPTDVAMARRMSDEWVAFARSGAPGDGSSTAWRAYGSAGHRNAIEFSAGKAAMQNAFFPELRYRSICEFSE